MPESSIREHQPLAQYCAHRGLYRYDAGNPGKPQCLPPGVHTLSELPITLKYNSKIS